MYKVKIYVTLKPSVLDPQGKTVENALKTLGYNEISNTRISKFIELDFDNKDKEKVKQDVESICNKVLANPNTETYYYEIEEK